MRRQSRAARGAGNLFIGNTLSLVVSGIGSILVARFLGIRLFGLYTLALVPAGALFVLTQIGVGEAVTRYTSYYRSLGEHGRDTEIVASAFILGAAVYVVVTLASYVAAPYLVSVFLHEESLARVAQLGSLIIVFQGFTNLTTKTLTGYFRTAEAGVLLFVQAAAKTVLSVGLVVAGYGILGAVTGAVASYAVAAAVGVALVAGHRYIAYPVNTLRNIRTIVGFGLPNYASSLVLGLSRQVQLVVLADLASAAAVGAFTAAGNIVSLIGVVSLPIATILLPSFSEVSAQGGDARMSSSYAKAVALSSLTIVPAAVFVAATSRDSFQLLYGFSYRRYYPALAALAAGPLAAVFGRQVQAPAFSAAGKTRFNAYSTLVFAAVTLGLSVVLAHPLGALGAAAASSAAGFASAIAAHELLVKRWLAPKMPGSKLLKTVLAASAAGAPVYYASMLMSHHGLAGLAELTLLLLAYTVVYATFTGALNNLGKDDAQAVREVFHRVWPLSLVTSILASYVEWIQTNLHRGANNQGEALSG